MARSIVVPATVYPIPVAKGGTASTTASAARTALGLGTAAVTNTGVSAGNTVVLDGSAKLPAVDGSQLTNLPGGTTNYAMNWHAGVATYYATGASAQTAAVSGDTIEVHGMLNEAGLGKAGVTYFFPTPSDGVTYTGVGTTPIFTDNGTGTNFNVTGRGYFKWSGSSNINGMVVSLTSSSTTVHFTCDTITNSVSGGNKSLVLSTDASLFIDGELLKHTIGGSQSKCLNFTGNGTNYAVFDRIDGDGMIVSSSTYAFIQCVNLYGGGNSYPIQVSSGNCNIITTEYNGNGSTLEMIRISGGMLSMFAVDCSTPYYHVADCNGGVLEVFGRFATTGTNRNVFNMTGGELRVKGGTEVIASGTGYSFYAASAQNVKIYGHAVANLDKHSNITLLCGTLEVDLDVT